MEINMSETVCQETVTGERTRQTVFRKQTRKAAQKW